MKKNIYSLISSFLVLISVLIIYSFFNFSVLAVAPPTCTDPCGCPPVCGCGGYSCDPGAPTAGPTAPPDGCNPWSAWMPFVCCPGSTQSHVNACGTVRTRACTQPLTQSCCGVWGGWGTCFGGCGGPSDGIQYRTDNCGYSQSQVCYLPPCSTAIPTAVPTTPPPTSTPRPPTSTPIPPTATPTRTPTPTPAQGPWIKLKDSSFISSNNLNNRIPALPTAYDSDDTTEPYFIINQGGVTAASSINIGPNPGVKTSNPEYKTNYSLSTGITASKFLQYIKSRKAYKLIGSLDEIDADGIYNYSGMTLDIDSISPKLNQFKTVIIVTGTININTNLNGASLKSLALLATDTINFSSTVIEANGIFVAPTISTGTTVNLGLKIIGNLVAQTTLNNNRSWADVNKPVVFVKFNPNQYINLLPYLSTVNYGWKQNQ